MPRRFARTAIAQVISKCYKMSISSMDKGITRRDLLRLTGSLALGVGFASAVQGCKQGAIEQEIAIVGGGIAGLNAGYQLKKQGVKSTIFEGSPRVGGRMMSVTGALGPGLVTELGGEFIDSGHVDVLALMQEFGLEKLDRTKSEGIRQTYFFKGRRLEEIEVIAEFSKAAPKIQADIDSLPESFDFEHPAGAEVLDRTSLADYIAGLELSDWMKDLLTVAFVTEFGLEATEQSAINMLVMISTETGKGSFDVFGESDELYKVRGGNQRITDELAKRLEGSIKVSHRLTSIRSEGKQYVLTFEAGGSPKEVTADIVLLTIPFTMLRGVDIKVELPEWKLRAINELGYGMNAKVMAGVTKRVWQEQGYVGDVFSDEPFQLSWDCSEGQAADGGGVAFYLGGKEGVTCGEGSAKDVAEKYLTTLNKVYPGVKDVFNGNAHRMHWPSHRFTKGSYACYKPGQWTTICGAEGKPVGNLFFAGEHCSRDFQGFMNGGAETGRLAAEAILGVIRD